MVTFTQKTTKIRRLHRLFFTLTRKENKIKYFRLQKSLYYFIDYNKNDRLIKINSRPLILNKINISPIIAEGVFLVAYPAFGGVR